MSQDSRNPSATIVAFDGLVADTLHARALALVTAISAEFQSVAIEIALQALPARSLDEAAEVALRIAGAPDDATLRDLVVLRARRGFTGMVQQGLPLRTGALAWLEQRARQHGRFVLRADSARRDVELLLTFSGVSDLFTLVRCADDLPRRAAKSSIERSWQAIVDRLSALNVAPDQCVAFEYDAASAVIARRFVSTVHLEAS